MQPRVSKWNNLQRLDCLIYSNKNRGSGEKHIRFPLKIYISVSEKDTSMLQLHAIQSIIQHIISG